MAEIQVDTVKMRACGNEIMDLANSIGTEFDDLFFKLANMPVSTFEWVGVAAEAFAAHSKLEKVEYVEFKNNLYSYGKYLVDCADLLDKKILELS